MLQHAARLRLEAMAEKVVEANINDEIARLRNASGLGPLRFHKMLCRKTASIGAISAGAGTALGRMGLMNETMHVAAWGVDRFGRKPETRH